MHKHNGLYSYTDVNTRKYNLEIQLTVTLCFPTVRVNSVFWLEIIFLSVCSVVSPSPKFLQHNTVFAEGCKK